MFDETLARRRAHSVDHASSTKKVMRIYKTITQRKILWSLNKFSHLILKEMFWVSLKSLYVDIGAKRSAQYPGPLSCPKRSIGGRGGMGRVGRLSLPLLSTLQSYIFVQLFTWIFSVQNKRKSYCSDQHRAQEVRPNSHPKRTRCHHVIRLVM